MGTKVTNRQIEALLISKPSVFANPKTPVKSMYWFGRIEVEGMKHIKHYYDLRQKLIDATCLKDDQGRPKSKNNVFEFPSYEIEKETNAEIKELFDLEVEFPFDPPKIDAYILRKRGLITSDDMAVLWPFVEWFMSKEDDEEESPQPKPEVKAGEKGQVIPIK